MWTLAFLISQAPALYCITFLSKPWIRISWQQCVFGVNFQDRKSEWCHNLRFLQLWLQGPHPFLPHDHVLQLLARVTFPNNATVEKVTFPNNGKSQRCSSWKPPEAAMHISCNEALNLFLRKHLHSRLLHFYMFQPNEKVNQTPPCSSLATRLWNRVCANCDLGSDEF